MSATADFQKLYPDAKLVQLRAGGYTVVVRKPGHNEWLKFKKQNDNAIQKLSAPENLVRTCCVSPDAAGLDSMFEDKPILAELIAAELMKLMGAEIEIEKKDLSAD